MKFCCNYRHKRLWVRQFVMRRFQNRTSFLYIRMMRVAGGKRTGVVAASVVIVVSQQSQYIWLRWGDMGNGCRKWWPYPLPFT